MSDKEQLARVNKAWSGSPRMKSIAPGPNLTIIDGFDSGTKEKLHATTRPKQGRTEDPHKP